jgi:hypothetical protein
MSYSCVDFTDDILGTLGIQEPEESQDSPEQQAELAIKEIFRRERVADDLLAALEAAEGVIDWALDNGAHPGARAVHALALAAIAKAKGRT